MPEARKRPCTICRRWFRPDARVGVRQRACTKPECQTARRLKTQASWRNRNQGYAIAWRLDRRATQAQQPPEALRLPKPLNQLPWEFAKDRFSPYLPDPARLSGALPPLPEKTNPGFAHTESRAGDDATGVSPTGPAMGTSASPRASPTAPVAGVDG